MKRFSVHVPGWIYAGTFYGKNRREAAKAARTWMGLRRLPNNTAIWEY